MTKTINLSQGKIALVDDCDYEYLSGFSWFFWLRYAARNVYVGGKRKVLPMHREVLSMAGNDISGLLVDHVDGDGLNNTRGNLRLATQAQNLYNRGPQKNNVSGYKGVSKTKSRLGRWAAAIKADGKLHHLGVFDSVEKAAHAYDSAAIALHGKFAYLNFPK